MLNFAGHWLTSFGPMELEQTATQIHGVYGNGNKIEGRIVGQRLEFRYEELGEAGTGWFALPRFGSFAGKYRPDGSRSDLDWTGNREFDGIWESSFGRLRLVQEESRIFGRYEGCGSSTIEGALVDGRFSFHYKEPKAAGEGWFAIDPSMESFAGEWRPEGAANWSPWIGRRVRAQADRTWLLVLEAHWQSSIAEQEYSFGRMLTEFFARYKHLAVRHRFFDDEDGLERWCRELLYFPEPAVVLIASHGTPEGINVQGRTIDSKRVIDSLKYAENLKLLHFSACLVMKEGEAGDFAKRIAGSAPFPISGYTTSVDWGGSAIIEFNFLDMILGKGMPPKLAAEQLLKLVGFAGDEAPEGSPYSAAGFRFFSPDGMMKPTDELDPAPLMTDLFLT